MGGWEEDWGVVLRTQVPALTCQCLSLHPPWHLRLLPEVATLHSRVVLALVWTLLSPLCSVKAPALEHCHYWSSPRILSSQVQTQSQGQRF